MNTQSPRDRLTLAPSSDSLTADAAAWPAIDDAEEKYPSAERPRAPRARRNNPARRATAVLHRECIGRCAGAGRRHSIAARS